MRRFFFYDTSRRTMIPLGFVRSPFPWAAARACVSADLVGVRLIAGSPPSGALLGINLAFFLLKICGQELDNWSCPPARIDSACERSARFSEPILFCVAGALSACSRTSQGGRTPMGTMGAIPLRVVRPDEICLTATACFSLLIFFELIGELPLERLASSCLILCPPVCSHLSRGLSLSREKGARV